MVNSEDISKLIVDIVVADREQNEDSVNAKADT